MTILPDGDIGLLYETGELSSISRLVFARFPIEWLVGTDDTDEDGVSDFNEDVLGMDKNDPNDAAQDPDGDGMNSGDEALAGTLPFDGSSILRPDIVPMAGSIRISWPAVPYVHYSVETTTNLMTGGWTPVPGMSGIRADTTSLSVEIPDEGNGSTYYRVVVP